MRQTLEKGACVRMAQECLYFEWVFRDARLSIFYTAIADNLC